MKFKKLRNEYQEFIYNSYFIEECENFIYIEFNYTIKNLESFKHTLKLDTSKISNYRSYNEFKEEYNDIIFNLGIMEAISYYKLTCSSVINIECGYLNENQKKWFKKVFFLGLGEFFYINKIDITQDELFEIKTLEDKKEFLNLVYENDGILIPIGGGKDSVVTIELLKEYNPTYFIVNPKDATKASLKIVDIENNNNIIVSRNIDKKLLELNPTFLNGHIPITAIMCFITYFAAFISKKKYIAFSNESSASEASVIGTNINHQYSKSLEYEKDFINYSVSYMPYNIKCFSFLRGLNEIQITKIFSIYKQYHPVFKSCNQGSKLSSWVWCCDCPKCLFVYLMLSIFLAEEELVDIFKENLLNKEELLNIFLELIGKTKTKPFECVGTIEEVNYIVKKYIEKEAKLPYLIKYYKEHYYKQEKMRNLLNVYNDDNCIEEEFENIIKGVLNDWENN